MIIWIELHMLNHPCIFRMKPNLVVMDDIVCMHINLGLPIFYWKLLHISSPGRLVCNFLFVCIVFIWIWYQGNIGFIEKSLEAVLHFLFQEEFGQCSCELPESLVEICSESIWSWACFSWELLLLSQSHSRSWICLNCLFHVGLISSFSFRLLSFMN